MEEIPVVFGKLRSDFKGGIRFLCPYCKKYHLHGRGEGHRVEHCDRITPFSKKGYYLRLLPSERAKCPEFYPNKCEVAN